MTRHRAPDAPARRPSSHRRTAATGVAGAIVADAIGAGAPQPAAHDAEGAPAETTTALLDRDRGEHDPESDAGSAVVVQDGPAHRSPAAERARGRRQLAFSAVSALCVAGLVGMLLNATSTPRDPAVGVDDTGFGVLLADPPQDGTELPRTLVDPPSGDGPAPGRAADQRVDATGPGTDLGTVVARGRAAVFSGAGSPWVQRAVGPVDPGSDAMVAGMGGEKFQMSYQLWTVPVYYADAGTPRYDVPVTAGWTEFDTLQDVPIPAGARPDPSEDAHLAIVDRSKGCVYDFWGASGSGGDLSAKLANAIPIDSTGAYPGGLGSRASGFSAAAGLVTAEELRRGSIDHALVFAYPRTRSGGPVGPATKSDGQTGGDGAIPLGARVRLDPSIDLGSLGLDRYELIIAKAMQRYGMILGDTSGGFTIYAQHPQSLPDGAYDGLLPDSTWVDLSQIPTDKLQVMELGPQRDNESGTVGNRCNGH